MGFNQEGIYKNMCFKEGVEIGRKSLQFQLIGRHFSGK
jgi:hypothetical protein